MPSVLWDAVVIPGNDQLLSENGQAIDFVKDQYRHCKTILVMGETSALVEAAGLPLALADGRPDLGLLLRKPTAAFLAAVTHHRHFEREVHPPAV